MKQLILSKFPWPVLPTIALVIFFVFFVALFVITHVRSRTPLYARASALPLEEGNQESNDVHQ